MAKLTKEQFIDKINNLDLTDEVKISLMEDITDSMDEVSLSAEEKVKIDGYDELKFKYDELLTKYKERFTTGSIEDVKTEEEPIEELEEKEIIDIKEI